MTEWAGTPTIQRIYQEIGERIAERRKELGWRQDDLAKQMGWSRASIANLETGRQRILLHHTLELADVLDMNVSDLLGLKNGRYVIRDVMEVDPALWPSLLLQAQGNTDV